MFSINHSQIYPPERGPDYALEERLCGPWTLWRRKIFQSLLGIEFRFSGFVCRAQSLYILSYPDFSLCISRQCWHCILYRTKKDSCYLDPCLPAWYRKMDFLNDSPDGAGVRRKEGTALRKAEQTSSAVKPSWTIPETLYSIKVFLLKRGEDRGGMLSKLLIWVFWYYNGPVTQLPPFTPVLRQHRRQ